MSVSIILITMQELDDATYFCSITVQCMSVAVQAYEKDAEDYQHEVQVTVAGSAQNGVNGLVATDQSENTQSSLVSQLGEVTETSYQALVAASSQLLSKMDSAVSCCGHYRQLADEVGQTLPDVESLVDQCAASGIADSEAGLQHQLDLVTSTANRVAGLGKVMTEYERAGTSAVEALTELGLADSERVHTIEQDVEATKSRFTAVQRSTTEQQRLVNSAFAQLQDPSHNLAVLLNWVCRSYAVADF